MFAHYFIILVNTCACSNYHYNGNMENSFVLLGSPAIFHHLQFLACTCEIKHNEQEPNDI